MKIIKIDKKIPIPNGTGRYGQKYPFREMKVGDSFLFPKEVRDNTARSNANQQAKRLGAKFMVRITPKGLRCWRVE